jgi:hypothetical protein
VLALFNLDEFGKGEPITKNEGKWELEGKG